LTAKRASDLLLRWWHFIFDQQYAGRRRDDHASL
jgi:hypothetical protein